VKDLVKLGYINLLPCIVQSGRHGVAAVVENALYGINANDCGESRFKSSSSCSKVSSEALSK
jgi:hypothetical protein